MNEWIVTQARLVEETTHLRHLVIKEGGSLVAPEGKFIHLSDNGAGRDPKKPGDYYGDIVVSVAETYPMSPHGLMKMNGRWQQFHDALVITDNQIVEGRDLAGFDPEFDVLVELKDMEVVGDFFNSTTELHMEEDAVRGDPADGFTCFGGLLAMPEDGMPPMPEGEEMRDEFHYDKLQRGAKNVVISLKNTRLEGVISSASFAYREGLTEITAANRCELSNITQSAAPTVNNGVIVKLDKNSTWYVTGTSYITSLELERTSLIYGKGGKRVVMTVDGVETPVRPGKYTGKIVLTLN